MRSLTSIALAATLVLTGCSTSPTPDDTTAGDATDMVVTSTEIAQACADYSGFWSRCGAAGCYSAAFDMQCPTFLSHYRNEILSIVHNCLPTLSCPGDAGMTSTVDNCALQGIASLTPTAAERDAAGALCAACPAIAGSSVTTAAGCTAAIFDMPDGGPGSGVGTLLRYVNDATAAAVQRDCVAAAHTDGGTCSGALITCMFNALGYSTFFTACTDAGTDASRD